MKRFIFPMIVFFGLILSLDSTVYAQELPQNEKIENTIQFDEDILDANATVAWRWWHRTAPIPYEGQTKYFRITKNWNTGSTCYDGYLGAKNVGGGYFIYEGYLYICGQPRPIPTIITEE